MSDDSKFTSTQDCTLLFERILIQLIKNDHKKCLLQFGQTVFQFVNDFASTVSEQCFDRASMNHGNEGTQRIARICSNLVEHCYMLLNNIPQVSGKVHFGGQNDCDEQEFFNTGSRPYDEVSLRKVLLLVLKLILVSFHEHAFESWLKFVAEISYSQSVAVWLVELFSDQDDELVHLLFCLLQLYQKLLCGAPSWASHLHESLNPHIIFMEFLTSVNYDHSLLLDFLISNETHFLPYFYNYLRHLANDWHGFAATVEERRVLTKDGKLPEGNSTGFLSPSSELGAAKSFSANDGDEIGNGDDDGYKDGDYGEVDDGDDNYEEGDDGEIGNGDNDGYKDDESDVVISDMNNVQRILTCLIRLRYSIERMSSKGLFPYTVTALVKIMEHIETLYEAEG
jgi:hypothetical protein